MKHSAKVLVLLLLLCLTLCGCTERDYVKATDGDFTVSISPDAFGNNDENSTPSFDLLSEEASKFVGVWRLESITNGGAQTLYSDSYYIFAENGSYSLTVNGATEAGRFSALDGYLYIGNAPVKYTLTDNLLVLETAQHKIHTLIKVESQ